MTPKVTCKLFITYLMILTYYAQHSIFTLFDSKRQTKMSMRLKDCIQYCKLTKYKANRNYKTNWQSTDNQLNIINLYFLTSTYK